MADNPDIQWALNLLQPYEEKSVFYKNGTYVVTSILGFSFGAFRNYFRKRPLMSGIQEHCLFAVAFSATLGLAYVTYCDARSREKTAVARDYIIKHPDDFLEAPKKTYAEVFDSWLPIR